ncbi:MAG: hypothetical protein AB7F79_08380 [Steroidobacteraceae bacterium]
MASIGSKSLLVVCFALFLSACSASSPALKQPREYLDPQTAATVTIVDQPLVFAHERPERAANVRDYVTVAAVAVNRSGKMNYFLIAYFWSTVDTRVASNQSLAEKLPVLIADDRSLQLTTSELTAHDAGIGYEPHRPAGVPVAEVMASIDLATLRYLSLAHQLTIRFKDDATEFPYELWNDQRDSLARFVQFLSGSPLVQAAPVQ